MMAHGIFIGDLDKAEVLVALFVAAVLPQFARVPGFGDEVTLSVDEAQGLLDGGDVNDGGTLVFRGCFDRVKGRALHVSLDGDSIDATTYDQDYGAGATQRVIDQLRSSG